MSTNNSVRKQGTSRRKQGASTKSRVNRASSRRTSTRTQQRASSERRTLDRNSRKSKQNSSEGGPGPGRDSPMNYYTTKWNLRGKEREKVRSQQQREALLRDAQSHAPWNHEGMKEKGIENKVVYSEQQVDRMLQVMLGRERRKLEAMLDKKDERWKYLNSNSSISDYHANQSVINAQNHDMNELSIYQQQHQQNQAELEKFDQQQSQQFPLKEESQGLGVPSTKNLNYDMIQKSQSSDPKLAPLISFYSEGPGPGPADKESESNTNRKNKQLYGAAYRDSELDNFYGRGAWTMSLEEQKDATQSLQNNQQSLQEKATAKIRRSRLPSCVLDSYGGPSPDFQFPVAGSGLKQRPFSMYYHNYLDQPVFERLNDPRFFGTGYREKFDTFGFQRGIAASYDLTQGRTGEPIYSLQPKNGKIGSGNMFSNINNMCNPQRHYQPLKLFWVYKNNNMHDTGTRVYLRRNWTTLQQVFSELEKKLNVVVNCLYDQNLVRVEKISELVDGAKYLACEARFPAKKYMLKNFLSSYVEW